MLKQHLKVIDDLYINSPSFPLPLPPSLYRTSLNSKKKRSNHTYGSRSYLFTNTKGRVLIFRPSVFCLQCFFDDQRELHWESVQVMFLSCLERLLNYFSIGWRGFLKPNLLPERGVNRMRFLKEKYV